MAVARRTVLVSQGLELFVVVLFELDRFERGNLVVMNAVEPEFMHQPSFDELMQVQKTTRFFRVGKAVGFGEFRVVKRSITSGPGPRAAWVLAAVAVLTPRRRRLVPQVDILRHFILHERRRLTVREPVITGRFGQCVDRLVGALLDPGHVAIVGKVEYEQPRFHHFDLVVMRDEPGVRVPVALTVWPDGRVLRQLNVLLIGEAQFFDR